ncbi:hypothetical protein [Actinomadura physcomitrii]|nr:hypothetical protein [Actinomadura physcomitrii]
MGMTVAMLGLVACSAAMLAASTAVLAIGRRPRYRGRHRAEF